MTDDSKGSAVRGLDRINLRLPAETFEAIDAARADRPGAVSRNTWITEAIEEKLARAAAQPESRGGAAPGDARRRHA